MGADVDDVLAYETPKVVRIRDRHLGVLKYVFVLCIFMYVIVWQLLYKGSHLQMDRLSGVARMQLQHPTKSCNPMNVACAANYTSLQQLPYCGQYNGTSASPVQRKCAYFDALELLQPLDAGYLIPTFIQSYSQVQGCIPNETNHHNCERLYDFVDAQEQPQKTPGRARPIKEEFVGDIEDFSVLIDHSFRVDTGSIEYDDRQMQGYWLDCSQKEKPWSVNDTWLSTDPLTPEDGCVKKPIVCRHRDCKQLGMITDDMLNGAQASMLALSAHKHARQRFRRRRHSKIGVDNASVVGNSLQVDGILDPSLEHDVGPASLTDLEHRDVYSLASGDVLSLGTLYSMAGRSLDDVWYDQSDKVNMTTRLRGTVLVVNIHYNNMRPWTLFRPKDPPEYVISVTSRPVQKYKNMKAMVSADKESRKVTVSYGTLVIVQSSGTIGIFSMIHMLIVVSTSLGLLAAATVVTDIFAIYVMPMRDRYYNAKFEETEDFSENYPEHEAGTSVS